MVLAVIVPAVLCCSSNWLLLVVWLLVKLLRTGEHGGDELSDVTIVRWPDEMYEKRLPALSRRFSSWRPSWE